MSKKSMRLFLLASLWVVAGVIPHAVWATPELDRSYALETVGHLRAWDNVDGLFSEYVSTAYRNFFAHQSRFILQDISKADPIFNRSKIPYLKLIEDPEVLGQLARATKTESLIRTKIQKEGPQYRFSFAWLHSPHMEQLATGQFVVTEQENGKGFSADEIRSKIEEALNRMIAKLPFLGTVTGRDNNSATVNIGTWAGLKSGDTLVVGTLDEVKKHPLLREIVDWRITRTGKLQVEQVEEGLAFCKVIDEEPGRQIGRYQKLTQIIPKQTPAGDDGIKITRERKDLENPEAPPSLGWMGGTGWLGGYSRQFGTATGPAKSGGGILLGVAGEGQLWLTREWFAEMSFGYGFWKYAQQDIATATDTTGNISGSLTTFKLGGGYTYLVTGDFFGPKAWFKFGLHSTSYSLPPLASEYLAPSSFKAPYLGVGGELPIRDKWGAQLNLEFGLFSGGSETGNVNGQMISASDVRFFVGGYYRWSPKLVLRGGFDVISNGGDFSNPSGSMSQKVVTISPSLLYYF